jgi:acetoin utilization protein AcuC
MNKPIYLVHTDEYKNWIFDPTHPTQGRRFTNARDLLISMAKAQEIEIVEVLPRLATKSELERVHSPAYINQVLDEHTCDEWDGPRPDMSHLAALFVGGTLTALDALLTKKTNLAINFPGAKHHAQFDYASGFCIFNDFALAADIATKDYGLNVLILDIDAHHGDGVENLTKDNPKVITFSIHQGGIFPVTGDESEVGRFYNIPLESGADDQELLAAIDEFINMAGTTDQIADWRPDILFITCGADGHEEDPLTGLAYSVACYVSAVTRVKERFPHLPILLGGAGGYLPDTRTPEIWAKVAISLANRPGD